MVPESHGNAPPVSLPAGYLPPYGTRLTVDSFAQQGSDTWAADGLDARGSPARYELTVTAPGRAMCRVNGEPTRYRNIYSHQTGGLESSLLAWFDWILATDAAGRLLLAADDYGGETVAAQLFRAEHHLVRHDSQERCLTDFTTLPELQGWLDEALAPTPLRTRVVAFEAIGKEPALLCDLLGPVRENPTGPLTPEAGLRYLPMPFGTAESVGFVRGELGDRFRSMTRVGFDGSTPSWVHAVSFVPTSELAHFGVETRTTADGESWWAILLDGVDVCLVIPRGTDERDWPMNISAGYDQDGQEATIGIRPTQVSERENRLQDHFQRRWGRWLDAAVVLDDEELAAGLKSVEAMLDKEFGGRHG
ncbi:hypothetical protein ACTQ49_05430 [Luteococcus sp. Sow4_B9]|uniref:hypothetical protein n=1 Tax=Luteococcus sp. Sow4_B9 TaxID=3438792 RepID=UPI003F967414